MHGVSDPAPRILAKEITPISLDCEIGLERIYASVRERQLERREIENSKQQDEQNASEKMPQRDQHGRKRRLKATCYMETNMKLLPHLNQAFESMNDNPKKKDESGQGKSQGGGGATSLAQKMNFTNKGPIMPPPPNNSNQTGISIAKGSYLNTSNTSQPTWKAIANGDQKHFYSNVFGGDNLPNQKLNELENQKKRQRPSDGGDSGFYEYGGGQSGQRNNPNQ